MLNVIKTRILKVVVDLKKIITIEETAIEEMVIMATTDDKMTVETEGMMTIDQQLKRMLRSLVSTSVIVVVHQSFKIRKRRKMMRSRSRKNQCAQYQKLMRSLNRKVICVKSLNLKNRRAMKLKNITSAKTTMRMVLKAQKVVAEGTIR